MAALPITTCYAAATSILVMGLALRVISLRRRYDVSLGDGDRPDLRDAIRTHGNLIEYAPLTLILLALFELSGAPDGMVHLAGGTFVLGRILHAISMLRGRLLGRTIGTTLTFTTLVFLVATDLYRTPG